jgi:hypothetical protein
MNRFITAAVMLLFAAILFTLAVSVMFAARVSRQTGQFVISQSDIGAAKWFDLDPRPEDTIIGFSVTPSGKSAINYAFTLKSKTGGGATGPQGPIGPVGPVNMEKYSQGAGCAPTNTGST